MDPYVVTSMIADTTILWKPWAMKTSTTVNTHTNTCIAFESHIVGSLLDEAGSSFVFFSFYSLRFGLWFSSLLAFLGLGFVHPCYASHVLFVVRNQLQQGWFIASSFSFSCSPIKCHNNDVMVISQKTLST